MYIILLENTTKKAVQRESQITIEKLKWDTEEGSKPKKRGVGGEKGKKKGHRENK